MKHDDIIRMAQEIAAQYSKAERFQTWTHDFVMQRLMELVAVGAAVEREACAKLLDDASGTGKIISCTCAAKAIRARGNA
jgi:aspartokinase